MEFNRLELAVLDAYGALYSSEEPRLALQIANARPTSRENSGAGFFTEVTVDPTTSEKIIAWGPLGQHYMHISGLEHGLGLILFFSEGYLSLIEGYSQAGEDTNSIDFSSIEPGQFVPIPSI